MSKKLNIMFDIDGVLADFVRGYTKMGNARYGTPVIQTTEQPKWDGFAGLDSLQMRRLWRDVDESPVFWYNLPPLVNDAVFDRINQLQLTTNVYFVTSRMGYKVHRQTVEWLEFYAVHAPQVLVLPAGSRKGEAAQCLQADYSIEDKAGNAVFIQYLVPTIASYILDRPYNRYNADALGSKVRRVYSVDHYLDDIEEGRPHG